MAAPGAERRWWDRPTVQYGAAALLFLVFAVAVLRPGSVVDCRGTVLGGPGDSTGGWIWYQWNLDALDAGPFQSSTPFAGYPEGTTLWQPHFLTWLVLLAPMWVFTQVVGPTCAYNLQLLVGLVASGLAMFGLVRWLTRVPVVAILAGGLFAFGPYAQVKVLGHLNYVHVWIFPLVLWAVLVLWRDLTIWRAVVVGLLVGLAGYVDGYYLLIVPVFVASLLSVWVIAGAFNDRATGRRRVLLTAVAGAVAVAALAPVGATMALRSSDVRAVVERDAADLHVYGARPWEYVLPSRYHPVFDDVLGPWQDRQLHRSNFVEQTLYLGWPVMLGAAAFSAWALRRRRTPPDGDEALRTRPVLLVVGLGVAALVTAAFSFPPSVFVAGRAIPMPARLIAKVVLLWRVIARFSIPLRMSLIVLAACGLALLVSRARRPGLLVAAVIPILVFDSLGYDGPERWSYAANTDSAYRWLADQRRPSPIAEYPFTEDVAHLQHQRYQTFQQVHRQPTVNGAMWASDFGTMTAGLAGLGDPQTIPALRSLGVRFVAVHPDEFLVPLGEGDRPDALTPQFEGDTVTVYGIDPGPAGSAVLGVEPGGWYGSEQDGIRPRRWMTSEGRLRVFRLDGSDGRVCAGFMLGALGPVRRVRLEQDGEVLWRGKVGGERITVSFVAQTQAPLVMTSDPGAIRVSELVPANDPRTVSVEISSLRATTNLDRCASRPSS